MECFTLDIDRISTPRRHSSSKTSISQMTWRFGAFAFFQRKGFTRGLMMPLC